MVNERVFVMLKKYLLKEWNTTFDNVYLVLCFLSAITVMAFLVVYFGFPTFYEAHDAPCFWHVLSGLYCAGCGGTRSVLLLFTGHPILSFIYHPIPIYCLISAIIFLYGRGLAAITRGRKNILHGTTIWIWVALALIIVNVIVKNAVLLIGHYAIIP